MFAPYTVEDLVNLAATQISSSIGVDHKALSYLAAKVAHKTGDARAMLALVESAIKIREESCTVAKLKGESKDDLPVVSMQDAVKAFQATFTVLSSRIRGLPLTAQMVLFIVVTMCNNSSANYTMWDLKANCSKVLHLERLESIDKNDDFKQLMGLLVDQGLLQANRDNATNPGIHEAHIPGRFGIQSEDVHIVVADMPEWNGIYRRLADRLLAEESPCNPPRRIKAKASAAAVIVNRTRAGCNHNRNKICSPPVTIHADQAVSGNFQKDDVCNPDEGAYTNVIKPSSPSRHATKEKKGTSKSKKSSSIGHAVPAEA